jgi:hypothetical protein
MSWYHPPIEYTCISAGISKIQKIFTYIMYLGSNQYLRSSVADPDPPDLHVFGPPGSGSTSQRYGSGSGSCSGSVSGSFYHHAKIVRKTLIPPILLFLFEFLSLKNDVNVAS